MNINKSCAKFFLPPPPHTGANENCTGTKFKLFSSTILIGLASLTSGCATQPGTLGMVAPLSTSPSSLISPAQIIKVTAVGYGASSSNDGYTPGQKRLMAMRASKLDAFRALAEQVQGVRVNGNSTVAAMMAQNDSFRVYVDAYLRGAQVITVTPMADGNYETTMEISLDDRFFGRFAQQSSPVWSGNLRGAGGPGYAYGSNFYYSE